MKETGVGAVKLEGGKKRAGLSMLPALCCWLLVRHMVDAGIAVQGHIGLTPQSVCTLGGFRVQGKTCIFCLHCFIDKMITPWESLRTRRLWRKQVVSLLSLNVYGLRDESHGCRFLLWSARPLPSPSMSPPSVLVQVLTLLVKYILSLPCSIVDSGVPRLVGHAPASSSCSCMCSSMWMMDVGNSLLL